MLFLFGLFIINVGFFILRDYMILSFVEVFVVVVSVIRGILFIIERILLIRLNYFRKVIFFFFIV